MEEYVSISKLQDAKELLKEVSEILKDVLQETTNEILFVDLNTLNSKIQEFLTKTE